jgi:hypothetical protein
MAANALDRQLTQLEASRYRFGRHEAARVVKAAARLERCALPRSGIADPLPRGAAFPAGLSASPSRGARHRAHSEQFPQESGSLRKAGADMDDFDTFEISGIAGTEMEDTLSFDVARWLVKRMPGKVEIAWENYAPGASWAPPARASCPARRRLLCRGRHAVAPLAGSRCGQKGSDPAWLIQRFADLPLPPKQKAELYESLRVPCAGISELPITRTRNWKPVRNVFYHREPLISRSQVSLAGELASVHQN